MVNVDACATCPLNPNLGKEERAPSEFIQQLLILDEYMQAGVNFDFDALAKMEWRGLALLKRKRNEKQIKDLQKPHNSGK